MPTTPIQALPYPSATGVSADVPRDLKALAEAVENRSAMRFASIAERDAKLPTGQRVAGMIAWVDADQAYYVWSTSGTPSWKVLWSVGAQPFAVATGSTAVAAVSAGNYIDVNITFPSGRFSATPTLALSSNNGRATCSVFAATATGATVRVANWTSAASAAGTLFWTATQMP